LLRAAGGALAVQNAGHALDLLRQFAEIAPARAETLPLSPGTAAIRFEIDQLLTQLTAAAKMHAESRLTEASQRLDVATLRDNSGGEVKPEVFLFVAGKLLEGRIGQLCPVGGGLHGFTRSIALGPGASRGSSGRECFVRQVARESAARDVGVDWSWDRRYGSVLVVAGRIPADCLRMGCRFDSPDFGSVQTALVPLVTLFRTLTLGRFSGVDRWPRAQLAALNDYSQDGKYGELRPQRAILGLTRIVWCGLNVPGLLWQTTQVEFWLTIESLYDTLSAMNTHDHTLLEAALIGYQHQAEQLAEKIADIRRQLGGKMPSAAPKAVAAPAKKRAMSTAARKRIAAAQRKRWAEYHKLKEAKA
jgi:hypothetical protein